MGATTAILVVIYVQDYVGWGIGFGMLAVVVAVALGLFLVGKGSYRREVPVGSPFTRVAQVLVAAARKWRVSETRESYGVWFDDSNTEDVGGGPKVGTLARTNQFRYVSAFQKRLR